MAGMSLPRAVTLALLLGASACSHTERARGGCLEHAQSFLHRTFTSKEELALEHKSCEVEWDEDDPAPASR
jgi:hypothetical protein